MSMYSRRFVVGILFIFFAVLTGTLTSAQEWAPHAVTGARVFESAAQAQNANRAQLVTAPSSNSIAQSPVQQFSSAPSSKQTQVDDPDGSLASCWNNPCPCAYVQIGALFLQRVPLITDQPIVVDPNTDTTFLSTSDLNFNFNTGLQATVGICLPCCRTIELDYFGLFGGNASATVVSGGEFLTFPDNLVGNVFVDMDRVEVDYSSSLHSFAVNLPCCCGCCDESCCCDVSCRSFTWFVGFRYLSLNDELNIAAQRTVAGAVEEGNYNIRTNNNLYGAQLGARVRRTRGRFGWDATGFAGIFGSDTQQTQSVTDFPDFPLRPTVSSSKAGVAFVGGANLSALYLLTNVWNLRAGYNVIWIEGLALAPNQLDFDFAAAQGGSQLNNSGGMFLHGVNVGLEARW